MLYNIFKALTVNCVEQRHIVAYRKILALLLLSVLAISVVGCRRVTLVSNSLVHGDCLQHVEEAINSNNGESWVYTKQNWRGSTSYNNPINHDIYNKGAPHAFGRPDVTVMSFGSNEMRLATLGIISEESAIQSMQTLVNQAVVAGSTCIVLLEASHHMFGNPSRNPTFSMHMDNWFDHWGSKVGQQAYLGMPYLLLIADISDEVHQNPREYLADSLHLTDAGAHLAAAAIVEQINQCPEGRWIYAENKPKPGASFPKNPYLSYPYPMNN